MADVSAEFRKRFSLQWEEFLRTPMGQAFQGVLISQIPPALTDNHAHKDHHRLGQIQQWQVMFNLITGILPSAYQEPVEIPQDYTGPTPGDSSSQGAD